VGIEFPVTVSAILPARNEEANIERAVASLCAQAEIAEIIVVDDESSDGTPEILKRMGAANPKVRFVAAHELPRGWVGKNHAIATGTKAASTKSDWLLFVDADTELMPGAVARALADAAANGAVMVSYSPEQEMQTCAERALIPFVFCRLARRFSYARVSDPATPDAAANGQFLLVERKAYETAGGHRAVRGEILEDVELARRLKAGGYRLHFAPGQGIARTRMYRTFGAMWEGWTKNLFLLVGGTSRDAMGEALKALPWAALVLVGCAILARGEGLKVLGTGGVMWLADEHVGYAVELSRNRFPRKYIQYYLPGAALYVAALVASAWRHTRGSVVWKGRDYPAGTP
jgi:hypothetical protein